MSLSGDSSHEPDESFGPGTDLVVSLFAVLLLLLVLAVRPLQAPADKEPDSPPESESPPPAKIPPQVLTVFVDYEEKPVFKKNRSILTYQAKVQLGREFLAIKEALEGDDCNQLLVEGHASPEAPQSFRRRHRERWNLKLSIERSLAVVDYLYDLGIPYECMSVAGFGRSHSIILSDWLDVNPYRTIVHWDEEGKSIIKQVDESDLAAERVVKILGIYHENSLCGLVRQRR